MADDVVIVDYDPRWPDAFSRERARIEAALGELALAVEHHGSTAVPGLAAKPVLDVMVAVERVTAVHEHTRRLEAAGYERRPIGDLPGRLYFRRFEHGIRRVHLSLTELDCDYWREHLAFRDALRADPELAGRYVALKRELASRYPHDRIAYTEAKTDFIREVLQRVLAAAPRSGWAGEDRR